MNALLRWWRFNLVGAMGMLVQTGALALLSRVVPGHLLAVSAAAVELAILHNFCWHRRYTWGDRPGGSLLRFQLSNGLVSLLGSLVVMRLLVEGAHAPVLLANLVAIVCCSLVNFSLGNAWNFRSAASPTPAPGPGYDSQRPRLPLAKNNLS